MTLSSLFSVKFCLISLIFIAESRVKCSTSEPYCVFGICSHEEYCCGDNECCAIYNSYVKMLWILFALVLTILLCGCLCNKCRIKGQSLRDLIPKRFNRNSETLHIIT